MKLQRFVTTALLVLGLGAFAVTASAQHGGMAHTGSKASSRQGEMTRLGKKGELPITSPTRVGDVLLEPGTYRVQHVVEGEDHFITFRKMSHTRSDQPSYPLGTPGKEVARVKCRLAPLGEKAKHSGMRFGTNAAGEQTVEEVHVKGEDVRHVF
jgi:hypothetical protein